MGMLADLFSHVPWMHVYVGFSLAVHTFEQYLNVRQLRRLGSTKTPALLSSKVSDEEFKTANAYNADNIRFDILGSAVQTLVSVAETTLFLEPWLWRTAGRLVGTSSECAQSSAFLGLYFATKEMINMPFQIYRNFVIEERHGFNKMTFFLFVKDKLISWALTALIGTPLALAVIPLAQWGGETFYLKLWGVSMFATFAFVVIYPSLIAPLFNKFQVLEDSKLRGKIDALVARVGFPLKEVYQMDASKRSSHSNAYFYGFWKWKRIVICDTLLHLPHDEIVAVLGHELGHWKKSHTIQRLVISCLHLLATCYLFGKVVHNSHLYESFGFKDTQATIIGASLFCRIYAPVEVFLSLVISHLTRRQEFEADAYAVELGFGEELKASLMKIHSDNKASLDPDPWFSWWHYTHPTLIERLRGIDAAIAARGEQVAEPDSDSKKEL